MEGTGASPLLVVAYWRRVAGGRPALVGGGCPVPPGRDPARSGHRSLLVVRVVRPLPHVPLPVPAERAGARAGHRASMGRRTMANTSLDGRPKGKTGEQTNSELTAIDWEMRGRLGRCGPCDVKASHPSERSGGGEKPEP